MDKAKRFLKKIQLKNKQRQCNNLYEEQGLSDQVLDMQVEINKMRHESDIADSSELESGYCQ